MLTLMPTDQFNQPARDPVVALGQLFRQTGEPFNLLFTGLTPDLRYQLAAAELYEYDWWNVFDEIQGIRHHVGLPAQLADLDVPAGVTPLYRNQDVYYYRAGELVMQARIALAGYLWQVERQLGDGRYQLDQYDDRGFVTTRAYFHHGEREKLEYYDDYGRLVLTETAAGVAVSEAHHGRFGAAHYANIGAVVSEFLARRNLTLGASDHVITGLTGATLYLRATQPLLHQMIFLVDPAVPLTPTDYGRLTAGDQLVFPTLAAQTTFDAAYADAHHGAAWPTAAQAVIAPRAAAPVTVAEPDVVPPSIYWRAGNLPVADCLLVAKALVKVLQAQPDLELTLSLTPDRVAALQQALMQAIAETFKVDLGSGEFAAVNAYLEAAHGGLGTADAQIAALRDQPSWPRLVGASQVVSRLTFVTDMADRRAALQSAQLLLDTGSQPKQSLQLAAVSLGIPQLTLAPSALVRATQNGAVVRVDTVGTAITNWRQPAALAKAQVASQTLAAEYAAERLLKQWKELTQHG